MDFFLQGHRTGQDRIKILVLCRVLVHTGTRTGHDRMDIVLEGHMILLDRKVQDGNQPVYHRTGQDGNQPWSQYTTAQDKGWIFFYKVT